MIRKNSLAHIKQNRWGVTAQLRFTPLNSGEGFRTNLALLFAAHDNECIEVHNDVEIQASWPPPGYVPVISPLPVKDWFVSKGYYP